MPTTGIESLSPELLQIIANFLPPSDVLNLSSATEKAAFLLPDFDQVEVNNNMMIRAENCKITILDIEVSAAVNEVMVTFKREAEMPVCNNFQPVVFKRNLFVTEDATTYDLLSAKKLEMYKVSTLRGEIAERCMKTFAAKFSRPASQFSIRRRGLHLPSHVKSTHSTSCPPTLKETEGDNMDKAKAKAN